LGNRSLLAHPGRDGNLERMNNIKGREQFRPIAPMVLAERASEIFYDGPIPSPFMLFTHAVRPEWRDRIPAVVHVDGSARIQTIHADASPLMHRTIAAFERRTGLPWSSTPASTRQGGRSSTTPETHWSASGQGPVDVLALGPFVVRRANLAVAG
jgi:carbamoyltransferase